MLGKKTTRYGLTIGACALAVAVLSQVGVDQALATRLISERTMGSVLARIPQSVVLSLQNPNLHGPESCRSGVQSAIERRRSASTTEPENRNIPLEVSCRVEDNTVRLQTRAGTFSDETSHVLPSWWAALPPIVAVFVALGTRQLLVGLVLAIWMGALLSRGFDVTFGLWTALRDFVWPALSDRFRLNIVLFTSALVGMANITTRAGGAQGIAQTIARLAKGTRSTRLASLLMGLALFFDDYANCIVVGTTMRPLADRVRLSREKLAYIVDSTAAPVAGVAIISTWIGYEVSLFDDLSTELALGTGGYDIFLRILPIRFYCFLTLGFVLLSTLLSRDFGPMLEAERRAQETGKVLADDAKPLTSRILSRVAPVIGVRPSWPVAAIPVGVVILATMVGLVWSGASSHTVSSWAAAHPESLYGMEHLRRCLQSSNGAFVLLNAALTGSIVAIALALTRHKLREPGDTVRPTGMGQALGAAALPLGFGLSVLLIHNGSEAFQFPPLSGAFWRALTASAEARVVLIGTCLGGILLLVQVFRRMVGERRSADRVYPLYLGPLFGTWFAGARAMVLAICILILAWSIQAVCQALDTSIFLVAALSGALDPLILPLLVFLISGLVAFSTGTSWGTMGILIPTVMPLAYHFGGLPLLLISAGAVLDGAIFGDHCSPISDTTVLSSMASGCDHIHHVKTQLPYACVCMGIAILAYLSATAGIPLFITYLFGFLLIAVVLRLAGKPVGHT